jgi:hypothetical protein
LPVLSPELFRLDFTGWVLQAHNINAVIQDKTAV